MTEDHFSLGSLDDMPDPGARQFLWEEGEHPLAFFLVRRRNEVFAYVNQCPHAGHQLNWMPDRFLTRDGGLILCNSHGARFRIYDGFCVEGPCPGENLRPIAIEMKGEKIFVRKEELQAMLDVTPRFP